MVEISDKFVESSFRAKAAILLPDLSDRLEVPAAHGAMPAYDLAVAQWCYDKNEPAGAGTDTLPANPQLYLPLKAPMRVRGVLVVEPSKAHLLMIMIPEQRRLLDTFAALVAIALERIHFVSVAQDTLIKMESERLRNTLLAALSHDLRTPLTALVGLAETLSLELAAAQSDHADKASVIREQAFRISKLMNNLLEMARLQSGEVKLRKDWQSIEEIVGSALQGLDPALTEHPLKLDVPANLPLVRCDALLIERVLMNLLENATKYTPPRTTIGVTATRVDDVAVADRLPRRRRGRGGRARSRVLERPGPGLVGRSPAAARPSWPGRSCRRRCGRRSRSAGCCWPGRRFGLDPALLGAARADLVARRRTLGQLLPAPGWCCAPTCCGRGPGGSPREAQPRRYDTAFFVALLPDGQQADAHTTEAVEATWWYPDEALEQRERGEIRLMAPTLRTLREIAEHAGQRRRAGRGQTGGRSGRSPRGWCIGTAGVVVVLPGRSERRHAPPTSSPRGAGHDATRRTASCAR